jgi:ABC-2 type transport system ATP-binding protein
MTVAIETRGLRRTFGELVAVDGLDLEVRRGAMFGFLGPNGAGKSTTIKMLTGLLHMTSGSARILGHDVAAEPVEVKRRLGVVPEEMALFDRLTGPEYLRFVGRMYGLTRETISARSAELLELMGLADTGTKLVVDYSHGMQKKLAFAAAIMHSPGVLFLDEPFEGIDAVSSRLMKSILDQLRGAGVTVFLTSHILEIVERLCTEVAVIHQGRLVAQGTLEELRARAAETSPDTGAATLEELFLTLVGQQDSDRATLSWLA